MYHSITLLYTRNQFNIVNKLYFKSKVGEHMEGARKVVSLESIKLQAHSCMSRPLYFFHLAASELHPLIINP